MWGKDTDVVLYSGFRSLEASQLLRQLPGSYLKSALERDEEAATLAMSTLEDIECTASH